jgi:hypothetical protein
MTTLPFLTVRQAMRCTACRICMRLAFSFSTSKMHERGQWAGGRFCPFFFSTVLFRLSSWGIVLPHPTCKASQQMNWISSGYVRNLSSFFCAKFKLKGVSNPSLWTSASLHRPRRIYLFSYKHRSTKDYMRPGQKLNKRGIFVWLTQGHQTSDSYDYGQDVLPGRELPARSSFKYVGRV